MGCGASKPSDPTPSDAGTDASNPVAVFTCSMGVFKATLFLDRVPLTVSNFISLAEQGFYDGIHFHRVIPNFMDQFGCPHATDPNSDLAGTGGPEDWAVGVLEPEFKNVKTGKMETRLPGGNIKDEHLSKDSNGPGTLSMANTGAPNTGGSQIFINVADNKNLDWFSPGPSQHPVFGKVVEGYDVCVAISEVPTNSEDRPNKPIRVSSVKIEYP